MNNMMTTIGQLTDQTSYFQSLLDPKAQNTPLPIAIPTSKRYRFNVHPLVLVFNQAMKKNAEEVIKAAEKDAKSTFYPKWKSVCLIDIPTQVSSVRKNRILLLATMCSSLAIGYFASWKAYNYIKDLTASSLPIIIPVIVNNAPLMLIKLFNKAIDIGKYSQEFLIRNVWKIFLIDIALACTTKKLAEDSCFRRISKKITIVTNIINGVVYGCADFSEILHVGWKISNIFCGFLLGSYEFLEKQALSENIEKNRICSQKAFEMWENTIKVYIPSN
jgi:hypothetical protein